MHCPYVETACSDEGGAGTIPRPGVSRETAWYQLLAHAQPFLQYKQRSLIKLAIISDTNAEAKKTTASLVPRPIEKSEKRAWYLLFAHVLNFPTFWEFRIIPCTSVYSDVKYVYIAIYSIVRC